MNPIGQVLVTGGAGYVGAVLVPKLLGQGYRVKVLDLYLFGDHVLNSVKDDPNLEQIRGDIRDRRLLERAMPGCDAVIHLASVSNDPSFDLDPELGKSINYDSLPGLVDVAQASGVHRFVYASTSGVYGLKDEQEVTEDLPLQPMTGYTKYKALGEEVLLNKRQPGFVPLIIRPATVCGYSPRLRLDVTVNILTNHAVNNNKITVFGGRQTRPNIHIDDMSDLYVKSLEWEDQAVDGNVFNVGHVNHTVSEIAEIVRRGVGEHVEIITTPSDDTRSSHISSEKIHRELGFVPQRSIEEGVQDLVAAFGVGRIPDPLKGVAYSNVETMKSKHQSLRTGP